MHSRDSLNEYMYFLNSKKIHILYISFFFNTKISLNKTWECVTIRLGQCIHIYNIASESIANNNIYYDDVE